MAKDKQPSVKKKAGRKPNHDYTSKEFLDSIERYASKGYTDKEIAFEINLNPVYFCEKKSELTELAEALSRGRAKINNIVRQRLLAVGLGGIKIKRITKQKSKFSDDFDDKIVHEEETELAPNAQVLSTWLFNHDEEWRKQVMDGKRLDVTSNGESINNGPLVWIDAESLSEEQLNEVIKKMNND